MIEEEELRMVHKAAETEMRELEAGKIKTYSQRAALCIRRSCPNRDYSASVNAAHPTNHKNLH
ncbi:MAG: hypothetical protein NTU95_05155 [Methanothrix sp.]|nr:hypothetical protein [Methanothrix sp.]